MALEGFRPTIWSKNFITNLIVKGIFLLFCGYNEVVFIISEDL